VGSVLGRHDGLIPATQTAVSVAPWFGRDAHGFSAGAGRAMHVWVASIGQRAGRGWRGVVHSMPCTVVRGMRPARACTGTRVVLSASTSVQRTARTRVGVWPIGALDDGRWVGGEGGGVRGSMARGLPLASSLRLSPNGRSRVALAREREREMMM
jgi:hypothetical protein